MAPRGQDGPRPAAGRGEGANGWSAAQRGTARRLTPPRGGSVELDRLAIEAADMGTFELDIPSGRLDWDDRLIELFGYRGRGDREFDSTLASIERRVHPEDLSMVVAEIEHSIESAGTLGMRYRVLMPDGGLRWMQARGRVFTDDEGRPARMLGVMFDVTAQQDGWSRAQRVLSAMPVGVISLDADFALTWANGEAERITRMPLPEMVDRSLWDLFPRAVGTVFETVYRRVARTRQPEHFEAFYPEPLNNWTEVRAVAGGEGGIVVTFIDVTAQHNAQELLQLSVDIGEELVRAADTDTAAAALARRTVPRLADWAIVALVEPDGRMRDVMSWHGDQSLVPLVERYAAHRLDGGGSGIVQEALERGEPRLVPNDVVGVGRARLPSNAAQEALAALNPKSAAVVPLVGARKVVGVLSLYSGAQRQPMNAQELAITSTICRRAGLAVENRQLFIALGEAAAHDRSVARALQEALMTTLPEVPGITLDARYLPAADRDQVGGDWYDALVTDSGSLALAIGDVMGHDIVAAGQMGQLRGTLRTFVWDRDEQPARLLERLDRAIDGMRLGSMASVVAARVEPPSADGSRVLRWSSAGHPPPLIVSPNGDVEVLASVRSDTLLGVFVDRPRRDHERRLAPGSTLLLYTDGLIETRGVDIDEGIRRLVAAVFRYHDRTTGELLDAVLAELVGSRPGDDVALLAVRVG